jgi:hypothetical protein
MIKKGRYRNDPSICFLPQQRLEPVAEPIDPQTSFLRWGGELILNVKAYARSTYRCMCCGGTAAMSCLQIYEIAMFFKGTNQ